MPLTTRDREEVLAYTGWSETFFESVVKRFSLGPCKGCYSFDGFKCLVGGPRLADAIAKLSAKANG